jgi:hypothetical protein
MITSVASSEIFSAVFGETDVMLAGEKSGLIC